LVRLSLTFPLPAILVYYNNANRGMIDLSQQDVLLSTHPERLYRERILKLQEELLSTELHHTNPAIW